MIDLDVNERAFLEAAVRILQGFEGLDPRPAGDAFAVDTTAGRIPLAHAFRETETIAQDERLSQLSLWLAGTLSAEPPPVWEEVAPRLVPVLRPTVYRAGWAAPLVRVPFAPLLFAHVAFDNGQTQRLLVPQDAARFQQSFGALLSIACENLARLEHTIADLEGAEGVSAIANDDGHEAARLVLPGFLARVAEELEGPVVCAAPNANTLLFVRADDERALLALLEIAESEWRGNADAISPVPFSSGPDGSVVPLAVPEDSALFEAIRRAHVLFLTQAYADQRASILEAAEEAGEPVSVAACAATNHPELGTVTTTHLLEGLIPVTDLVFLVWQEGDEEHALLVDRSDLLRISPGCLLPAQDYDPPLCCALSFPSDEQLAALAAVAHWQAAD